MNKLPRYYLSIRKGDPVLLDANGGYLTHGELKAPPDVCLESDVLKVEAEVIRLLARVEELKTEARG